ncbi:hypothetical protein QZH41_007844 [Actinostola sp. cb2023]|nr:hypothetical protein QZH41_007844 [Actinostola sp. cb2023]
MDGKTAHDGRVEVRTNNGQWSTICNYQWDLRDAYVVCHMLNYSKAVSAGTANVKGSGPIYPNWLDCYGHETSIEQCSQGSVSCEHSQDAAIVCGNSLTLEEKAITVRLVGTNVSHVGQVEIQYNGTWGAVCLYNWDIEDAHVICRMLGYKTSERPIWYIEGETTTKKLMDRMGCSGKEKSITECAHLEWWNVRSYCTYKYLAGVVCQVDEEMSITNCSHRGWGNPGCLHSSDIGVTCKMAAAPQFTVSSSSDKRSCTATLSIIDHAKRNTKEKELIKRGREGQRSLSTTSFKIEVDANGRNYATMAHDEASKNHPGGLKDVNSSEKEARLYETEEQNDGFKALQLYLAKINHDSTAFFQYPKKNWKYDEQV